MTQFEKSQERSGSGLRRGTRTHFYPSSAFNKMSKISFSVPEHIILSHLQRSAVILKRAVTRLVDRTALHTAHSDGYLRCRWTRYEKVLKSPPPTHTRTQCPVTHSLISTDTCKGQSCLLAFGHDTPCLTSQSSGRGQRRAGQ